MVEEGEPERENGRARRGVQEGRERRVFLGKIHIYY